jgi:uncharacterized caspase-like protein
MSHFFSSIQRLTAVLILFAAAPVYAQGRPDPNLEPTYGAVTLAAGFNPDPVTKEVQAGGELTTKLGGVRAYVAKAPDFRLNYTADNSPLVFTVKSVGDTTLLINLPDGTWIADDDSGGGLDPMIRIAKPKSGRYDIYVGTFKNDIVAATLFISERDPSKTAAVPFNPNLPECHIVSAGIDNYRTQNKLQGCLNDARNTVRVFEAQTGLMYRSVKHRLLLDDTASHGGIVKSFRNLTNQGAAGDTMVLFLSGHGARTSGNKGNTWFFLPVDFHPKAFANTALTDVQILDISDQLVRQKKNVVVIVDACYSGQLAVTAQPYLKRYQATNQGGLALLLSSSPNQESAALGNYSAFAKAFADSMAGGGDLNGDSKITLGELQIDSKKRTYDLLAASRNPRRQDANATWSPSLSKDTPLAAAGQSSIQVALAQPLPNEAPRRFTGTETLPGFGKLSFAIYSNGRAIMTDAKSTQEGIWRQQGDRFTLSFANGAVVYTGALNGATLSGTATSPSTRQAGVQSWTWNVQRRSG